jgi:endonuclease III
VPKTNAQEISKRLARMLPEPITELDHENAWQLLVATILSAQSTDKTINAITPALFEKFPTPHALAAASQGEIEELVKKSGFFRNKAKSIRTMSQALVERHAGEVPRTMEELVELPGVARKTANLILGHVFGVAEGVLVDTHVIRVAGRLALSAEEKPERIEADLMKAYPKKEWIGIGNRLLLLGRYVCTAKNPKCEACPVNELCPSKQADPITAWTARADAARTKIESRGATADAAPAR